MSIKFNCAECSSPIKVPDESAGRRGKCRACGHVFRVPGRKVARIEVPDSALEEVDEEAAEDETEGFGSDDFGLLEQLAAVDATAVVPEPEPRRKARAVRNAAPPPAVEGSALPRPAAATAIPYRSAASSRYAGGGNDSLAAGLIAGFLLVFAVGTLAALIAVSGEVDKQLALNPAAKQAVEDAGYYGRMHVVVWTQRAILLAGFFAFIGPFALAGIKVGGKVSGSATGEQGYLRSLGVAAAGCLVLGMLGVLVNFGVVPMGPPILAGVTLGSLVAIYAAIQLIFGLDSAKTAVAFAFVLLFGAVGMAITGVISNGVRAAQVSSADADLFAAQAKINQAASDAAYASRFPQSSSSGGTASTYVPVDPEVAARERLAALTTRAQNLGQSDPDASREAMLGQLAQLKVDAAASLARPDADPLRQAIATAETEFQTRTSERPQPSIYEPLTETRPLTGVAGAPLADPVAAGPVSVKPPAEARLDLKGRITDPAGLTWTMLKGEYFPASTLNVRLAPKSNDPQRRPVIATRSFMVKPAVAEKLLVLDLPGAEVEAGAINGIPLIHAGGLEKNRPEQRVEYYAGLIGDQWLVVTVLSPVGDAATRETLNAAARSVRLIGDGSPPIDPFSAEQLAARLGDSDEAAGLLTRLGAAAEPAVLPMLKVEAARGRAATVLQAVGTSASIPALEEMATAGDGGARAALVRIDPEQFDAVHFALIDIERNYGFSRRDGMKTLAAHPPVGEKDTARRQEVASALEPLMGDFFMAQDKNYADAMVAWSTPSTPAAVLSHLGENAGWNERATAITIAGGLADPSLVRAVARWTLKEPKAVKAALLKMGPLAEDEVIKLLREKSAEARRLAAEVLAEIGTRKSIAPLYRAKNDPRNESAAAAAERAWSTVSERAKAGKPE